MVHPFFSVNLVLHSISCPPPALLLIHGPIVPNLVADSGMKTVLFFSALWCGSIFLFTQCISQWCSSLSLEAWKYEQTGVLVGTAMVCSWCQNPTTFFFPLAVTSTLNIENGWKAPNAIFLNRIPLKFLTRGKQISDWKVEKLIERTDIFWKCCRSQEQFLLQTKPLQTMELHTPEGKDQRGCTSAWVGTLLEFRSGCALPIGLNNTEFWRPKYNRVDAGPHTDLTIQGEDAQPRWLINETFILDFFLQSICQK